MTSLSSVIRAIVGGVLNRATTRRKSVLARAILPFASRWADSLSRPERPPVASLQRRLYIGPANWAGQGQRWAHASARYVADTFAVNMAVGSDAGFHFPADILVAPPVYNFSAQWQVAEFDYVTGFSHVLIEAERPLFGGRYGDCFDEARALRARGLAVAMLCHGHDIRLPSRHSETHRWSPYERSMPGFDEFEREAVANKAGLDALGAPVFVSTPDLLVDVPYARWCPLVVEMPRWATEAPVLERAVPRVVHIPSDAWIKGSDLIAPALAELESRGLIEYELATGVDSRDMPALYGSADIVLDQFRIGSYGAAACEAMASGRIVLGQVDQSVRDHIKLTKGVTLPIVEADPGNIGAVIERIVTSRTDYAELGRRGIDFVSAIHDGRESARALGLFLS